MMESPLYVSECALRIYCDVLRISIFREYSLRHFKIVLVISCHLFSMDQVESREGSRDLTPLNKFGLRHGDKSSKKLRFLWSRMEKICY